MHILLLYIVILYSVGLKTHSDFLVRGGGSLEFFAGMGGGRGVITRGTPFTPLCETLIIVFKVLFVFS